MYPWTTLLQAQNGLVKAPKPHPTPSALCQCMCPQYGFQWDSSRLDKHTDWLLRLDPRPEGMSKARIPGLKTPFVPPRQLEGCEGLAWSSQRQWLNLVYTITNGYEYPTIFHIFCLCVFDDIFKGLAIFTLDKTDHCVQGWLSKQRRQLSKKTVDW